MKTLVVIAALAVAALAGSAGWQVASRELANRQLQDDMRDLAVQGATRIGLSAPISDDELRSAVIAKATQYDIPLQPNQVRVVRAAEGEFPPFVITADYESHLQLLGFPVTLHFAPTSTRKSS